MIVPTQDRLVIEVRLNPLDVDKVSVGQQVIIRIPGLNARETPDLPARVMKVAPDLTRDQQTGISYFHARVMLDDSALKLLPAGETLMPGMPAEAYIQTGSRTVLTYLLEPLEEQFRRAMRENLARLDFTCSRMPAEPRLIAELGEHHSQARRAVPPQRPGRD